MTVQPTLSAPLQRIVNAWLQRDDASVLPRVDGGVTLRRGIEEIGHLHADGTLHLAFPRALRDAMVRAGAVDPHPAMPDSGWVTYRIAGSPGIEAALDLLARADAAQQKPTADTLRQADTSPSGASASERTIDEGVEESFPASDPPSTSSST